MSNYHDNDIDEKVDQIMKLAFTKCKTLNTQEEEIKETLTLSKAKLEQSRKSSDKQGSNKQSNKASRKASQLTDEESE